jgi:RimJ/RimL family protein N-acetyltransferase
MSQNTTSVALCLRPVTSHDASFLCKLCNDVQVRKALAMGVHDSTYWVNAIEMWLQDPDEENYIIETRDHSRSIGWIGFNDLQSKQRVAWIKIIALIPDVWNKGYCKVCMELAKQLLVPKAVHRVRLWTDFKNVTAIGCYKASGFSIVKQELRIVGDLEEQRLQVQMECLVL